MRGVTARLLAGYGQYWHGNFTFSSEKLMKSSAVRVAAGNAGAVVRHHAVRCLPVTARASWRCRAQQQCDPSSTRSLSQRTQHACCGRHHRMPRGRRRCAYGGSATRACDTDDAWLDTRRQTTAGPILRKFSGFSPPLLFPPLPLGVGALGVGPLESS